MDDVTEGGRGRISRRDVALGLGLATGSAASFLLMLTGPRPLDTIIEEDGVVETVGALGILAGSVLFLLTWWRIRRGGGVRDAPLLPWSLLGLGVLLFLAAGEEISWGQRILRIKTPESLAEINAQDETNLHNLDLFSGGLDADRLFQIIWFSLFVVVPLVAVAAPAAGRRLRRLVPVVPLWLGIPMALTLVFMKLAEHGLDEHYDSIYPLGHTLVEIKESVIEVLIGVAGLVVHRTLGPGAGRARRGGADADGGARRGGAGD